MDVRIEIHATPPHDRPALSVDRQRLEDCASVANRRDDSAPGEHGRQVNLVDRTIGKRHAYGVTTERLDAVHCGASPRHGTPGADNGGVGNKTKPSSESRPCGQRHETWR